MKNFIFLPLMLSCLSFSLKAQEVSGEGGEAGLIPRTQGTLTQEEQKALSPSKVLELLQAGNQRFTTDSLTRRTHSKQVRAAVAGQFPKAVILSCLDSRIPVEDVFDCGIGDLFVARIAGNFANVDIVGSMEFACKVAGSKLVLVVGHADCGAVKGAIDGVELGNLTQVLRNISPAIERVEGYADQRKSSNKDFLKKVTEQNVRHTLDYIRKNSPILKTMESSGEIIIVGAVYNMETGEVTFLE